jgi:hypothetical protein
VLGSRDSLPIAESRFACGVVVVTTTGVVEGGERGCGGLKMLPFEAESRSSPGVDFTAPCAECICIPGGKVGFRSNALGTLVIGTPGVHPPRGVDCVLLSSIPLSTDDSLPALESFPTRDDEGGVPKIDREICTNPRLSLFDNGGGADGCAGEDGGGCGSAALRRGMTEAPAP